MYSAENTMRDCLFFLSTACDAEELDDSVRKVAIAVLSAADMAISSSTTSFKSHQGGDISLYKVLLVLVLLLLFVFVEVFLCLSLSLCLYLSLSLMVLAALVVAIEDTYFFHSP